VDGQLAGGVTAYANYALQRAVDAVTDERLTNSPAHLGRAGVSMRVLPSLGAAAELRYESGRETIYGTRTDEVLLTNLNLTSARLWQGLHASLRVQNAFDRNYATPGGFEHVQPAIRQDGRTVTFELGYRF
jgi:iron complex outermembrane receptor protein